MKLRVQEFRCIQQMAKGEILAKLNYCMKPGLL